MFYIGVGCGEIRPIPCRVTSAYYNRSLPCCAVSALFAAAASMIIISCRFRYNLLNFRRKIFVPNIRSRRLRLDVRSTPLSIASFLLGPFVPMRFRLDADEERSSTKPVIFTRQCSPKRPSLFRISGLCVKFWPKLPWKRIEIKCQATDWLEDWQARG